MTEVIGNARPNGTVVFFILSNKKENCGFFPQFSIGHFIFSNQPAKLFFNLN